eukprot:1262967-Amorphochlora_amoeboformis.AAC.1
MAELSNWKVRARVRDKRRLRLALGLRGRVKVRVRVGVGRSLRAGGRIVNNERDTLGSELRVSVRVW